LIAPTDISQPRDVYCSIYTPPGGRGIILKGFQVVGLGKEEEENGEKGIKKEGIKRTKRKKNE